MPAAWRRCLILVPDLKVTAFEYLPYPGGPYKVVHDRQTSARRTRYQDQAGKGDFGGPGRTRLIGEVYQRLAWSTEEEEIRLQLRARRPQFLPDGQVGESIEAALGVCGRGSIHLAAISVGDGRRSRRQIWRPSPEEGPRLRSAQGISVLSRERHSCVWRGAQCNDGGGRHV